MKSSLFLLVMMFVGVASYGQHEHHMQKEEKPKEEKSKEEVEKPEVRTREKKAQSSTRRGKRVVYDLYVNDTTLDFVDRKSVV